MTQFVMLVGLPASGKSTYSDVFTKFGYTIHSSDAIREELFGNQGDQSDHQLVFNILHKRIKEDLKAGRSTVYDATNISAKRRMAFLREIERYNAETACFFIATPYQECIERDKNREHSVGEDVIKRMYMNFWVPHYYEGWDRIEILWSSPLAENNINDILKTLEGYDQKTPFHTLSLDQHMEETYNWAFNDIVERGLRPRDFENILLAIRIHDMGKPFTQAYNAEKDRCTYYQHQHVGAYDALFYLRDLHHFTPIIHDFVGAPKTDKDVLEIANYIQWHMYPYDIKQESTRERFKRTVGEELYDSLMFFHEADRAGH